MSDSEDSRDHRALHCYLLIEPLVDPDVHPEEIPGLIKKIACEGLELPDGDYLKASRSTLYRYLRAYRRGGLASLRRPPRSDRGKARVFEESVIERAVELRHTQKKRETRHLLKKLEQEFPKYRDRIKRSTLDRHLSLRGASRYQLGTIELKVFKKFQAPCPNNLWTGDVMHSDADLRVIVPGISGRRKVFLISWIDDYSRYLTHSEWYLVERLPSLEDCFKKAILTHGLPRRAYSDKGAIYEARIWRLALAELDVYRIKTRAGAKEAHGKIEKFHQTARSFEREAIDAGISTLDELNRAWWAYLRILVHERPHDVTKELPSVRYQRLKDPRYPDPQQLSRLFLVREPRTVNPKFSTVAVRNVAFRVDPMLRRLRVQVRFDPYSLDRVYIWRKGREIQVAYPASADNLPAPPLETPSEGPTAAQRTDARHFLEGLIEEADELDRRSLTGLRLGAHHSSSVRYGWTAFTKHLSTALRRDFDDLSGAERDETLRHWRDFGPFNRALVEAALARAIASKGPDQHVAYYLDQIKVLHFDAGSQETKGEDNA